MVTERLTKKSLQGGTMARPKTEYRNELKTRVTDTAYEAVQLYMQSNRCASEARAISELLELALFGTVGSVPQQLADNSHELAHFGTKIRA
jgi:hypothetical protein